MENVNLLAPELLGKISRPVVEHAHAMAGKAPLQILFGRGDSFVVKTDVHWPTDLNLLWDAIRSSLGRTARLAKVHKVPGWRKWKKRKARVKKLFHLVRTKRRETEENAKQREMNARRISRPARRRPRSSRERSGGFASPGSIAAKSGRSSASSVSRTS